MVSIIHKPSFCYYYYPSISFSSSKKKTRHYKHLPQYNNNGFSSLSFTKPSPTPLLLPTPPIHRTQLEALETVITDLETSSKKGITITEPETYASLLETCHTLKSINHGIRVHNLIPQYLLRNNQGISSKLVRLYASNGYAEIAHEVFDQMPKRTSSPFAWNSLISGYTETNQYEDAMALYFQMYEENVKPDRFTFPRVLKACGGIGSIEIGVAIHRDLIKEGYGYGYCDVYINNALIDMYAKCGDIVKARSVFDMIFNKDYVSWNSMLTGYIRHGLLHEALDVFRCMIRNDVEIDKVAISSVLARVENGRELHGWTVRRGMESELSVANALIVFYSRNGRLDRACFVFDRMVERDIVSWNAIIAAHSKDLNGLRYFKEMDVRPDGITFVSVLSICANKGMVKEGERLFALMSNEYGIIPRMEHYSCMVNLYGRVGMIDEAYSIVVEEMGFEAGATVWGALLYSCYLHGKVDIGEVAAQRLFELEPDNEHNFELLMRIYGKAKRGEDVERVRQMMVDRGLET